MGSIDGLLTEIEQRIELAQTANSADVTATQAKLLIRTMNSSPKLSISDATRTAMHLLREANT